MHAAVSEEGVYMNAVQHMQQRREQLVLALIGVGMGTTLPAQVGMLG